MFGKTYAFNRKTVVQQVSKFMEKGATFMANMDTSNKPMGERLEQICGEMINKDEDVQILIRRLTGKFGIDADLIIIPKFDDTTLLIKEYSLVVPNTKNELAVVVNKANVDELITYLTEICLTREEAKIEAFCTLVDKAVNAVK